MHHYRKWIKVSDAKYQDTLTIAGFVERNNETVLTVQVTGDFERSPVPLDFSFYD